MRSPSANCKWSFASAHNLVEFVKICSYFTVAEAFTGAQSRAFIPRDFGSRARYGENNLREIPFVLKTAVCLYLVRDIMSFASNECEDILHFIVIC